MTAIALLQSAILLLTTLVALGNNVPPNLQNQVITVANEAIAEANAEMTTPVAPIAPVSTGVSTTQTTTTSATTSTVAVMPAPTCDLSAAIAQWPQGTTHAQFTWDFTPGAVGKITQDGTDNSPQYIVRYAPGPNTPAVPPLDYNSNRMDPVYSGSLQTGQTYAFTLEVEHNGQIVECHTSVQV